MYYIFVEPDGSLNGAGQAYQTTEGVINYEVTEETFLDFINDNLKYVWDSENQQVIPNPNYEQDAAIRHRQELDSMTLTPADVERALYRAKGMDFEDLKVLIAQSIPTIDIKGLSIEFRAKDFYRGAMAGNMRLFDAVGQLLGYTSEDMDYLFEHKELPVHEQE